MIWNAARGGMRSVVEAYRQDGFLDREKVRLIRAYDDGSFVSRQVLALRALVEFAWCLLSNRVELVHVHASMRGSFWRKGLFSSLARLFGVPVILHLHGSEMKSFYAAQRPFVQAMIRSHLEKATRVLVLSRSWQDYVQSIAPKAAITIVPNYVSVPADASPEGRVDTQVLFLGVVGTRKGSFDLVEAFASVHAARPSAHLVIGGNGEVDKARALASQVSLGDDGVTFAGWVDGPAKAALLRQSGIYTLPSYNEGLPMSVLEAMAAGLVVVTTRVGGIPELITDGVDGLLIEAGDKEALANALLSVIDDAALRQRLALAGRQRVKDHYSDEVILPLLHTIYEDCRRPEPVRS